MLEISWGNIEITIPFNDGIEIYKAFPRNDPRGKGREREKKK